jgi:phospholipid/cholesterol/gamma-HCH transport system substrate-binding protein
VQAIILAVVVLGGLALGTAGLFAIGSRHWLGDAFHVRAGFRDVGGVEVGTRVRVQGLDAGEVEAIEAPAAPSGQVVLRLRLGGKFRHLVTADAVVEIAGESLLSGKVVRVLPGSPSAGLADDDALLAGRSAVELTDNLAHTAARLDRVLEGAEAVLGNVREGKGTLGRLAQDETLYADLASTIGEVKAAVGELRQGQGTLGKLVSSTEVHDETVKSLQDVRRMVSSVKQDADAIKALPIVRSYVVDANKELIRPDSTRYRRWLRTRDLFEPGRAVLTDRGKEFLDKAAGWINGHKEKRSEVVVAAFANPKENSDFAQTLTARQSEVVVKYLKSRHKIHRMGFWWWSNRTVRAIGCGTSPPPVPEKETLPPSRVELLVFVPQN